PRTHPQQRHNRSIVMPSARPNTPGPPTNDAAPSRPVGPPSKHQIALMIWVPVFPTLTVLNLALKPWLADLGPFSRSFMLPTMAVPSVIYRLMPRLHPVLARIRTRAALPPIRPRESPASPE